MKEQHRNSKESLPPETQEHDRQGIREIEFPEPHPSPGERPGNVSEPVPEPKQKG